MKITADRIIGWGPCPDYTEDMIREGIGDGKTPLEICDLDIPAKDKLWVLLREQVILRKDLHELGCVFAEKALLKERNVGREPHPDSWNAITVKRKWIIGEATHEELRIAREAAREVEGVALLTAKESLPEIKESLEAVWAAAWAAWAASWVTSRASRASWAVEEEQLKIVREYLEKNRPRSRHAVFWLFRLLRKMRLPYFGIRV